VGDKVWGLFFRSIRRFRSEESGVVLILVALLIVPLLLIIAIGIDFGQTLVVKRQLAGAVDSAALAIGTDPNLTDQGELDDKAEAFIRAHYADAEFGTLTNFTVTRTDESERDTSIVVTATAQVPTHFMRIGGVDQLTVTVSSEVLRRENELEVMMVLDNSGSMSNSAGVGLGTKMAAMQTAATTLVNALFEDQDTSTKVKIGLVPFSGGVNLRVPEVETWLADPTVNPPPSWLDYGNPADINAQFLALDLGLNQTAFTVMETMANGIAENWRGCVRSRSYLLTNYDLDDTPPDPADPNTLFSAYFNAWLGSVLLSYVGQGPTIDTLVTDNNNNQNCPKSKVQTLTDTRATIISAIDAMEAGGSTNIPEGLAWGWRMISPTEPFTEGAPYSQQETIKAIILLTDGENAASGSFSSYGQTISTSTLNTKTSTLCGNVKADKDGNTSDEDILIYTIVFNATSGTIQDLMRNCATDTGKYFDSPTPANLDTTFRAIANSLNQLRITE